MLAIILARNDVREFDQIISLYTREKGKLELLAKGIKKIVSKNSSNGEVLSCVDVEVAQGKEVDYLTKVHPAVLFKGIYADFDKIFLASYIAKMVNEHILVEEKDIRIFELLFSFLEFLNKEEKINSLNLAAAFIFKFWYFLGLSPEQEPYQQWLRLTWEEVNLLPAAAGEDVKNYLNAYQFAQIQSGKKLANFIENGRII